MERVAEGIAKSGFSVTKDFVSPNIIKDLNKEFNLLLEAGKFQNAQIGKGQNKNLNEEIRSDEICWLDSGQLVSVPLEELRKTLNRELFLGMDFFECHFARYAKNSFYKKHSDRHQGTQDRILSFVLYLNESWEEAFGGILRIYHEEGFTDIIPSSGTLVVFRSEILHEVLPTLRERRSLTGWMRKRTVLD